MTFLPKFIALSLLCIFLLPGCSSQPKFQHYKINANPDIQLQSAIKKAQKSKRPILLQIGGDWCPWTYRLDLLIDQTPELKKILKDQFIFVPINHSKDNSNLEFIHRFDDAISQIPHWLILNQSGHLVSSIDLGKYETFNSYQPTNLIAVLEETLKETAKN